jgi:ketosteroid isomerase-like protein
MAKAKSGGIKRMILDTETKFMTLYKNGNAEGLAALYTADGQIMPPNMPIAKGPAKLKALFKGFWKEGATKIKLDTVEVEGDGDLAYEVGKYTLSGKAGRIDQGKYIVVWKKVRGQWKLHRDIFNSNVKLPEPAKAAEAPAETTEPVEAMAEAPAP